MLSHDVKTYSLFNKSDSISRYDMLHFITLQGILFLLEQNTVKPCYKLIELKYNFITFVCYF